MTARTLHPVLVIGLAIAALLTILALTAGGSGSGLPSAAPSAIAGDKDCADFKNQKKAQKFFKKHNPKKDKHGLDADNDGIACESNPCPCKKKPAFRLNREPVARPSASCDRIKLKGNQRVFYKNRMNCRTAKTYARRVVRTHGRSEPKNFKCRSGSGWADGGSCSHKFNSARYFGWHVLD